MQRITNFVIGYQFCYFNTLDILKRYNIITFAHSSEPLRHCSVCGNWFATVASFSSTTPAMRPIQDTIIRSTIDVFTYD